MVRPLHPTINVQARDLNLVQRRPDLALSDPDAERDFPDVPVHHRHRVCVHQRDGHFEGDLVLWFGDVSLSLAVEEQLLRDGRVYRAQPGRRPHVLVIPAVLRTAGKRVADVFLYVSDVKEVLGKV